MSAYDAIDQSWSFLNPATAKRLGIKVVFGYLSHDPSKNWTAAEVRAYHAQGISVGINWESQPGRPLQGAGAGAEDARDGVTQLQALERALGYRALDHDGNPSAIVFSCDRDTTPRQYGAIDAYYLTTRGITHGAGFRNGVYGEFDLINHLYSAKLTDVEWQTLAWSGGRISPAADLYQSAIDKTVGGAAVDLDIIRNLPGLGVWAPPGSKSTTKPKGALMALTDAEQAEILTTVRALKAALGVLPNMHAKVDLAAYAILGDEKAGVPALRTAVAQGLTQNRALAADNAAMKAQIAALHGIVSAPAAGGAPADAAAIAAAVRSQLEAHPLTIGGTAR